MLVLYPGDVLNIFDAVGTNTDVEVWSDNLGPLYSAQAPAAVGAGIYTAQTVHGNIPVGVRCYNSGGSAVVVTVSKTVATRTVTGGGITSGTYVVVKPTLQTKETLVIDKDGIRTLDANGAVKEATSTSLSAATTLTSSGAAALAVGPAGATNPTFQIDSSTSSAATGIKITGAAAAGGVAVQTISSGTNENASINAKGSGSLALQSTATGAVTIGTKLTITTTASDGIAVGPAGATNPTFQIDSSTASAATGWKVTGAAAAGGVDLVVVSSGTNESCTINAKGSGTITFQSTGTGNVISTTGLSSKHATAGLGYSTGAGGTITQGTSKSTGVTLNKVTGSITMHNATLNDATNVSFTLTNSAIATTDVVVVHHSSAGTAGAYQVQCTAVGSGTCAITVRNVSGGNLGEAIVLSYAVIKGVVA